MTMGKRRLVTAKDWQPPMKNSDVTLLSVTALIFVNDFCGLRPADASTARPTHVCFSGLAPESRTSAFVKSFGRRQAYESPRGRNPRGTVDGYGDFDLRPMSAMA